MSLMSPMRVRVLRLEVLEGRDLLSLSAFGLDPFESGLFLSELPEGRGRAAAEVLNFASLLGWTEPPRQVADDVWFLGPAPSPLTFYEAHNADAADTINVEMVRAGGGLGLGLLGSGVEVGVWDEGPARGTHQEFGGVGGRVSSIDGGGISGHATHVVGTIAAAGVQPAAQGMAPQVAVRVRDWVNDLDELENDAGLISISNHSYGVASGWSFGGIEVWGGYYVGDVWHADRAVFGMEDPAFGKYSAEARDLDGVLANEPGLLSVWAAGNHRSEGFTNGNGDNKYVAYFSQNVGVPGYMGAGYYLVDAAQFPPPPSDGNSGTGFDSIAGSALAKNALTVGAVNDVLLDPYSLGDIAMTAFSSWGPVDDGRVKPDLVASGHGVYSAWHTGDSSYGYHSGTSMAAPGVSGGAALLVEHYRNLRGVEPKAATLKGLLVHTAFDAGNVGPDYVYGWGLVDIAAAAKFLSEPFPNHHLFERTYVGAPWTFDVVSDGTAPIKATLAWTDPAGSLPSGGMDDSTPVLVNNLNIRITSGGSTYYPWTLNPASPSAAAVRTQANSVDNTIQVLIDAPAPGRYTIHVEHAGSSFIQDYSLLITGAGQSDGTHTVGLLQRQPPVQDGAKFYLKNTHSAGDADIEFYFGPYNNSWIPIAGDWNADGQSTVGYYDPAESKFYLQNVHAGGPANGVIQFGSPSSGYLPIVGDWNGNGQTTLGLYHPDTATFALRNSNSPGEADHMCAYGGIDWLPVAGDWDADGVETVGVYNPSSAVFHLQNQHHGNTAHSYLFGAPYWRPIAGDWDGDGDHTVGVYNPNSGVFHLKNVHEGGTYWSFQYGAIGWEPIAGDWDGVAGDPLLLMMETTAEDPLAAPVAKEREPSLVFGVAVAQLPASPQAPALNSDREGLSAVGSVLSLDKRVCRSEVFRGKSAAPEDWLETLGVSRQPYARVCASEVFEVDEREEKDGRGVPRGRELDGMAPEYEIGDSVRQLSSVVVDLVFADIMQRESEQG